MTMSVSSHSRGRQANTTLERAADSRLRSPRPLNVRVRDPRGGDTEGARHIRQGETELRHQVHREVRALQPSPLICTPAAQPLPR